MLCALDFPIPTVKQFKARVFTLDINPLAIGSKVIVHVQSQKQEGKIAKIDKWLKKNDEVEKTNPK